MNPRYADFPKKIADIASATEKSLGATLYIMLPSGAQAALRALDISPRNQNMSEQDVVDWIQEHVIMRGEHEIIGIANGAEIIWSAQ